MSPAALLLLLALPSDLPRLPVGSEAERAVALLDPSAPLRRLEALDPARPEGWSGWLEALGALGALPAEPSEAGRAAHARLCDFALRQQRYERAWSHLVAIRGEPGLFAGLLPRFLPGVEGAASRLADGVTLRPALPPLTGQGLPGRVERREMRLDELAIGAARVRLAVRVEYEGVLVELTHLAGPRCSVRVEIPPDPDYAFGQEYLDWYPLEQLGAAQLVELEPGSDTRTLYGRFEPRAQDFPRRLPTALPQLVRDEGLALELLPGDPSRGLFEGLAAALGRAPLSIDACLFERGQARPGGIHIDFTQPASQPRRLALLAEAIETFVRP